MVPRDDISNQSQSQTLDSHGFKYHKATAYEYIDRRSLKSDAARAGNMLLSRPVYTKSIWLVAINKALKTGRGTHERFRL